MAVKKSQVEDKALHSDKEREVRNMEPQNKERKVSKMEHQSKGREVPKMEHQKEFNYPEHNITVKAKSKKEADKKLNELIN
jgi:hypothetical protein